MIANGTFDLNPKQIGLIRYSQERANSNYGNSLGIQRSANFSRKNNNLIRRGMPGYSGSFKQRLRAAVSPAAQLKGSSDYL